MEIKTHPDFKSVYPKITNADMMDDYVGHALAYQSMFDRRTTPWEKILWEDEELENFNIDLEKVDRLYYIYHAVVDGQNFEMAARMDYKGRKVYFELVAGCDFTGFECRGGGTIYVSGDANLFIKIIVTNKYQSNLIYQSLREDGIQVEELIKYDACSRFLEAKEAYDNWSD